MPELSKFYQWTDETIQSYRQQIISLLKEKTNIFMDIDEHMVYEKMYTADTLNDRFNAYKCMIFGLKLSLAQSHYLINLIMQKYLSGIGCPNRDPKC